MNKPRVLIADDHVLMLNGIKSLLRSSCNVVGTVMNGRQLLDAALWLKPDIIILDVSMPELNGIEAARKIHAELPLTKLIFLSMHSNPVYLRKAVAAGASAYVLKTGAIEELPRAIQKVLAGESYVSPEFGWSTIANLLNNSGGLSQESDELTTRQVEILQLITEGRTSKEIAHTLDISVKTVDFHRTRLMMRLGARSAGQLVRIAVEQGLIPPSTPDVS